jgi:hypothetical protein
MCDNEYLAHQMVRERIREAEARGALDAMLRQAEALAPSLGADGGRQAGRAARLEPWWQLPAAWVAHLALPKMWNRL